MSNKNSTQRIQEIYDRISGIKEAVGTETPEPEDPEDSEGRQGKAQSKTDAQLNYAGFWKRFAAGFIDLVILIILNAIVVLIVLLIAINMLYYTAINLASIAVLLVLLMTTWIYYAAYESSSRQATPGKTALGIKVTDLNGRRIGFGKATGRYFGKILSLIILAIGFITIAFTEKKQGLHDEMVDCLVVNK